MILKNTLPKIILSILLGVVFTLSYGQTGTINGTILDDKKEPVMGATVKIKGTGLGAATDMDGKFAILNVPTGKQVLQLSYIGYVSGEQTLDVTEGITTAPAYTLKEDNKVLDEVVVVGYGTQIKKDVSSSLSEVKSDALADKPVYDFTSSLQGQAAGVEVTTDNGLAGATTTVRIRGTKSLSNSAEPLYIIDGVPIVSYDISNADATSGYNISPMSSIDPADIESVVILKDASATAIYGSRGANGVIVVTTKHGKAGKPKVDVSFTTGLSQAAKNYITRPMPMITAAHFQQAILAELPRLLRRILTG
jgi:TonB-dependent SusC/RagA subfamily outer membrane receptor